MNMPTTKSRPPRAPPSLSSPTRKPRSSSSVASIGGGGGGPSGGPDRTAERKPSHQNHNSKHQNHHHRRTNTDSSKFSLVSALTDASGEFVAPRRRTLSWDHDETQNHHHQQLQQQQQPPSTSKPNNKMQHQRDNTIHRGGNGNDKLPMDCQTNAEVYYNRSYLKISDMLNSKTKRTNLHQEIYLTRSLQ